MLSVKNESDMKSLGERIGVRLKGGEVIELIGDVGAGKTTFVKGLAQGLQIDDDVQSPSFTISRVYEARDGLQLYHYDFYRLTDSGVLQHEVAESVQDKRVVTVIEWAETVEDALPTSKIMLQIAYTPDGNGRELTASYPEEHAYVFGGEL